MPHLPYRKTPVYPVYTVELVGGEEVGGTTLGTEVVPREPREETKRAKVEPPPMVQKVEKQTAKKEPARKEPVKKEERKPVEKGASMLELDKPERAKKEVKESPPAAEGLPESLREKLIQAALQKVRDRAAGEKKAETGKAETGKKEEKEPLSAGPGEGVGAAVEHGDDELAGAQDGAEEHARQDHVAGVGGLSLDLHTPIGPGEPLIDGQPA